MVTNFDYDDRATIDRRGGLRPCVARSIAQPLESDAGGIAPRMTHSGKFFIRVTQLSSCEGRM